MTTEKQTLTDEEKALRVRNYAFGCNGTLHWHKFTLGNRYLATDGAKFLADTCGAWWLLEAIASYFHKATVRNEPFQVWELRQRVAGDDASVVLVCEDGNEHELARQPIPYTDFPRELMPFKLYCEATDIGGAKFAVMLPEER